MPCLCLLADSQGATAPVQQMLSSLMSVAKSLYAQVGEGTPPLLFAVSLEQSGAANQIRALTAPHMADLPSLRVIDIPNNRFYKPAAGDTADALSIDGMVQFLQSYLKGELAPCEWATL